MKSNINYIKNKKLIAFDVDGTISLSRSKIDNEMKILLQDLIEVKQVAIITGGAFTDIEKQVLSEIGLDNKRNKNLTLLPTNGGALYIFKNKWQQIFIHKLTNQEKEKIIQAIKETTGSENCFNDKNSFGQKIQDRESEITYSALGENAPLELKKDWDPNGNKKKVLQLKLAEKLPEFEVKIGGTTSIDITPLGMDKAYALKKLMEYFKLKKEDILFVGDSIYKGGNDYPAYEIGIDTVHVLNPKETKEVIKSLFV